VIIKHPKQVFIMEKTEVDGKVGENSRITQNSRITKDQNQFQDSGDLNLEIIEELRQEHHQDMIAGIHLVLGQKEMNLRKEVNMRKLIRKKWELNFKLN